MHDYSLAIALIPLFIGVVLTQVLRLNLKGFLGVYLMMVASNVAFTYLFLENGFIAPLIIAAAGFIAMLLLTGIFGNRMRTTDYALVGFGIGLFPWTIGLLPAIAYAVVFAGFAILIALRPKFRNPLRRSRYKA